MLLANLGEFHKKIGYKHYVFNSFSPIEKSKIYKKGNIYKFTIRTLDENFASALSKGLKQNINDENFIIVEILKKEIKQFFISELKNVTPAIVSVDNGRFWTFQESGDIELLRNLLHSNLEKKYNSFFGEKLDIKQNFIQFIEINNKTPQNIIITKNDKNVCFFGNKFKIIPNEDSVSQKLAFIALGCGFGEKNSYGGGFCLAKAAI
jgi:CRISPR-associated endoribonuclease Cas6